MNKRQSLSGYIREHLESIEQRLDLGVRQDVIVAELEIAGYTTSKENLRNELWRARRRKQQTLALLNINDRPNSKKIPAIDQYKLMRDEIPTPAPTEPPGEEIFHASALPSKKQLESRANKYIKGSIDGAPIDSLLNPNKGK